MGKEIPLSEIATMDLNEIAELNEEVRELMDQTYPPIDPAELEFPREDEYPEDNLPF